MRKSRLLLFLSLALAIVQGSAQSLTNTATTITASNTCLNVPSGSYTMTIHYNDLITGFTGDVNYPVTVVNSAPTITITASTAAFPTVATTGFWDLSNVQHAMIELTNGTTTGYLRWDIHSFYCDPVLSSVTNLSTSVDQNNVDINFTFGPTVTYLTQVIVYRSVNGGPFYPIGTMNLGTAGYYGYADAITGTHGPGANNRYYFSVLPSVASGIYNNPSKPASCSNTDTVSQSCSSCYGTSPSPTDCSSSFTVSNSDICNLQDYETVAINGFAPNFNSVTWTASPANAVYLYPEPCNYYGGVGVLRTGAYNGLVTITATQSICNQPIGTILLTGTPSSIHPSVRSLGSNLYSATCDAIPGATDADYTWKLIANGGDSTIYHMRNISFTIPPCTYGVPLFVRVNTPCGNVGYQQPIVINNTNGCNHFYQMTPNPAGGTVQIQAVSAGVTGTSPGGAGASDAKIPAGAAATNTTPAQQAILRVNLYNKMGRMVLNKIYSGSQASVSLDISSLPTDVYTVQIISGKGNETQQLVVSH